MTMLLRVVQLVSFGMIALALMMLGSGSALADKTKKIEDILDCDQYNAILIKALGGPPGFPAGVDYQTPMGCTANEGSRCIYCIPPEGSPSHFIVLTNPNFNYHPGLGNTLANSCGTLWGGLCREVRGSVECVDDDGDANGTCADAIEYHSQPLIPPD